MEWSDIDHRRRGGRPSDRGRVASARGRIAVGFAMLLVMVLLSACAEAEDDTAGGSDGDSAENGSGTDEGESVAFQFAIGSAGVIGVPVIDAIEAVNEKYGHQGEFVDLAASEVAIEGVASNEYQFGAGASYTAMSAIQQQDADLTFVSELMRSDWTLSGKTEIQSCEDMDGMRMGLHSPGGVSTALFEAWRQENCPDDVEPEIVYIEGSPNRYQGLLADQLDVTMLQLENTLEFEEGGDFHVLTNFSESMPNIKTSTMYANNTFMEENPEVVQQLVTELIRVSREYNEDPSQLGDGFAEFMPETADSAHEVTEAYVEAGLVPDDGALSIEDMESTIDLFVGAEVLEPGLEAEDITTTEFVEGGVEELDG